MLRVYIAYIWPEKEARFRAWLTERIRALIVASAFLPIALCALSGGPIDGLVVEEGTNRSIAEAIVVFRWRGSLTKFLESSSWCYLKSSRYSSGCTEGSIEATILGWLGRY